LKQRNEAAHRVYRDAALFCCRFTGWQISLPSPALPSPTVSMHTPIDLFLIVAR
jgi:hypothetical protein